MYPRHSNFFNIVELFSHHFESPHGNESKNRNPEQEIKNKE
jgi:hypothetical protein